MRDVDEVIERLRADERGLLADVERVRAALCVLTGAGEPEGAHEPERPAERPVARVVRLDSVRAAPVAAREAAFDDVLAVVYLGVTSPGEIADWLSVGVPSVHRRLLALQRDGLVERIGPSWRPTDATRNLDWIEHRAREVARRAG